MCVCSPRLRAAPSPSCRWFWPELRWVCLLSRPLSLPGPGDTLPPARHPPPPPTRGHADGVSRTVSPPVCCLHRSSRGPHCRHAQSHTLSRTEALSPAPSSPCVPATANLRVSGCRLRSRSCGWTLATADHGLSHRNASSHRPREPQQRAGPPPDLGPLLSSRCSERALSRALTSWLLGVAGRRPAPGRLFSCLTWWGLGWLPGSP